MEDTTLYRHLDKLVGLKSVEELENLLQMLWQTRKTGLSAPQKFSLQSLLRLPLPTDLDPVLACLRSLLMMCLRENFGCDYILKLLPPDLTLEMQSMLLVALQKYQKQWKEELSQEGRLFAKHGSSYQPSPGLPMPLLRTSFPEFSGSLLPRQFPTTQSQFNNHNLGGHTSIAGERNVLSYPSALTLQNDACPIDTLGTLPQLKFMTWTLENKNAVQVAVITIKLQDCNKYPPTETEVKFQLTKNTLEAVLRSMTYINEQLTRIDQRVSFLYLANDILQNSRRKGSEFVNEFWKILPLALRGVYDSGDENCRKAATRLVFQQILKNELLGNGPPAKKLAVGGMPEKILTSFHLVHDEVANEDVALNKCQSAISSVQEIEIDVVNASSQGEVQGSVIENIEKQENMLHQCVSQLEKCETIRVALVSQLRGALQDQVRFRFGRNPFSAVYVVLFRCILRVLMFGTQPPRINFTNGYGKS
ncbi:hypothetical protein F511_04153 [Dorcoceras hygrometricum]|uniref:CID domain-containing protein n=1 Tax=Dorcoceras hygrometricum TaxID=472368 RepID=A0A2Z7BP86_9LAMI|nr:hypothetical protein F511_04153 [Dorcoceras hygrometricum]